MLSLKWQAAIFRFRLLIILVLLILFVSSVSPNFLNINNLINVLWSISIIGLMAVGSTFVILVGGIDLSVSAIAALSGIVIASLLLNLGFGMIPAILITLLVGAILGAINGLIITRFRVPDFILTFASATVLGGISMAVTGGETVAAQSASFHLLGFGKIFMIPVPVYIFFVIIVIGYFLLNNTLFGRSIYAVGGNKDSSRFSGIQVNRIIILAYMCSGLTAAIGGIILTSMIQQASSSMGVGYELDVIAAIVIGGTSLFGGSGSIQGTIFGALLIGLIENTLNLLNIPSPYHPVIKGIVIILAVALDLYSRRLMEKTNNQLQRQLVSKGGIH
jgi:ribose transport system permease protein